MQSEFDGKTVLITGAGRRRGMGAAEAHALVSQGANVVIGDIAKEGTELAAEIGERCRFVHLDVTDPRSWQSALADISAVNGALHGLVNNAAIYIPKPIEDATPDEFMLHMQVNQLGPFLGMKYAAPLIAKAGGGAVVNVSSSAGLKGSDRAIAYCGTKWALRGMTKAAAKGLAKHKIRVNSIHPGPIDTGMLDGFTEAEREARRELVPLRREGRTAEVADLVSFLLSDRSAFITGAEVSIDGGITL